MATPFERSTSRRSVVTAIRTSELVLTRSPILDDRWGSPVLLLLRRRRSSTVPRTPAASTTRSVVKVRVGRPKGVVPSLADSLKPPDPSSRGRIHSTSVLGSTCAPAFSANQR